MMMHQFKLLLLICVLMLSACASNPSAEHNKQSKHSAPPRNQAVSMRGSQKTDEAYSLYGIKLGENKSSVEDTYKMVTCRKSLHFFRCLILLDTRGVTGISLSDTATIFVTFKDDIVHSMTIPVVGTSLNQMREMLVTIYGEPVSLSANKTTWSNGIGSVVLEQSGRDAQHFSVTYTSNLY